MNSPAAEKPRIRISSAGQPGDDKRARLLAAALDLFEARGFEAVTVPEIAARAGVAVGTVYRYFETKEALVNALYRHWKAQYNAVVLEQAPDAATVREEFAHYWQRMMLFARTYPRALRFMDLHHHAPYLDEESRALSSRYAQVAGDFVNRARQAHAIRELDPKMVVALMWGACTGLLKFASVKFASQGALVFDAAAANAMEEALWRAIAA